MPPLPHSKALSPLQCCCDEHCVSYFISYVRLRPQASQTRKVALFLQVHKGQSQSCSIFGVVSSKAAVRSPSWLSGIMKEVGDMKSPRLFVVVCFGA